MLSDSKRVRVKLFEWKIRDLSVALTEKSPRRVCVFKYFEIVCRARVRKMRYYENLQNFQNRHRRPISDSLITELEKKKKKKTDRISGNHTGRYTDLGKRRIFEYLSKVFVYSSL